VRSSDPTIAETLRQGDRLSPTFHRLVMKIDQSDGIVYVLNARCPVGGLSSCFLHQVWMSGDGRVRYLRIHIDLESFTLKSKTVEALIPTVGHELQHAVEVLDDPHIRSAVGIVALLLRIGQGMPLTKPGLSFETAEARNVEKQIADEVATALAAQKRAGR